ncbi:LysR family transcriptional regulator [Aminobacter sp. NyZ550]|jgi:DNA-binding transcriptional LysR family regulator|uniref:DNA-binding transcriptional LysR family regulator n=3 Tax=Aminobacter TaxID=31988 RepID=A0AAC9AQ36_AMIAI|nr:MULTISPECIES: LysR family transcriptional regulator [Aminobacter]AMS39689.1 LysR family transcriptional regulator [Aminobacter aminovorans]MBA8907328.1 DNA-binding transcriptional LysR family regulator [Aminobacter ciceronei]MBA9021100.1 DNA-binding transcriptional LysR family regulator [Aminobacter ciceronei]MBB3708195.1 DNA-binding transcriptional LysR family regulator [Aminobacter aminovorans]WAX95959.1 LysR family transcriptional regulator [Aminobacter sp. NyZ550]
MASSEDMKAFVRIVDLGSFAKAADDLRITPSALSKLVSRLEDRLGVRLLTRTTRRLALTSEGTLFLERAREVLELIDLAEADVASARARPKGLLRVNSSTGFARQTLLHAIPEFLRRYPEVTVDLSLTDKLIDPVAEQVDVVLRGSPTSGSDMVARQLAESRRVICAAPSYLARAGTPCSATELTGHNCIPLSGQSSMTTWPLASGDDLVRFQPSGNFGCDNVGMLFDLAVQGHGIVRLADFVVGQAVREGRLIEILADINRSDPISLWAVMPKGRFRAPRVQAFLDFMGEWLEA